MIHKYCKTETEQKIFNRVVEKERHYNATVIGHQIMKTIKQVSCPHCDEILHEEELGSELIDWYDKNLFD